MRKLFALIALSLLLCGLASAQGDRRDERRNGQPDERITQAPIVEATGATWATVAWSTNTGGSSVVRYGRDPNQLSQRAQSPYANDPRRQGQTHRVKINHLIPGTTYYFVVKSGQGEGTGTEAWSQVGEFTTRR